MKTCKHCQVLDFFLLVFVLFGMVPAVAEDEEDGAYIETIAHSYDFQLLGGMLGRLEAHGNNLMGDMIDKKTGGITLEHTDISIPGNSGLEVAIHRKRNQGAQYHSPYQQAFGGWALDLPVAYIGFGYDNSTELPEFIDGCMQDYGEMGGNDITTSAAGVSVVFPNGDHTDGIILNVPGKGLSGFQGKARSYTVGISDPKSDWISGGRETDNRGRCAEVVIAPDGTKYKFGRHIFRKANDMNLPVVKTGNLSGYAAQYLVHAVLPRKYAVYLITEVEDKHGNWVRYEYTDDERAELTRIHSNDAREIEIHYQPTLPFSTRNSRLVSHITAHNRTWQYGYEGWALKTVTLPDGRYWDFYVEEYGLRGMLYEPYLHWNCVPIDRTFSIKHPDGAIGTFTLRETRHIKSAKDLGGEDWGHFLRPQDMPPPTITDTGRCNSGGSSFSDLPPYGMPIYRAMSLVSKTISGPNIPEATWEYEYRGYTGGSVDETWTRITEPDGTEQTYTYQAVGFNHGILKRVDVTSPGGAGESIAYEYDYSQQSPANCDAGGEWGDTSGACYLYGKRPQTKITRLRDGVTYTKENEYNKSGGEFIDYGRPNTVTRYSTLQPEQRVTEIEYWHNTSANIIGLTERVTHNDKEFVFSSYNSTGQVEYVNSMGNLWENYTYHPDGTLETITDPLGHTATLTDYHRGQPQHITRRNGTTLERAVNDSGWVTTETNARGYTTHYSYTDAGWMTLIDRPSPWADTNISYYNLGESDFYRSITRGTKETVEWFDSMLRPRLVRENPTSDGGATSYVKTQYDGLGRTIFTSQPSTSSDPTQGTETTYDGLGRVIQTRENFYPFVTNIMEYLSANRVRVTDPLGHQTTTTRSGYSSPKDGAAILIEQPEGVSTSMIYDPYGNVLTATQGGNSYGNLSSTQIWSYDERLRVCRHYTPETGSKLFQYDDANQVARYSEGNSGTTGCASIPAGTGVTNSYDEIGQIEVIDYSDETPDVYFLYDDNGNVELNQRGSTAWTYSYDSLDQLTSETLNVDGRTYGLSYQYNTMSSLISRTLPSGRVVNYDNNGLGRVIAVESGGVQYASGIDYHVNGLIAELNYGNGQIFSQTLSNRLQPLRLISEKGSNIPMDLEYSYDVRGDVTEIVDWTDRNRDRSMTYDGLGRMNTADGAWGSGTFAYDPLGNLRQKQLGSRVVSVSYNGNNRASQSTDTAGSTRSINYDSRGNVTELGTLNFVHDMANQPVQLSGSSSGNYTYDGNFKRVKAVVDGEIIYNVYDASGSLVHIDKVTGGASLTVCLTSCGIIDIPTSTDYIRANGMTIARLENGKPTYLHPDHLGSPVAGTDALGNIAWQEHYTPYGEKWQQDAANDDQMGFTGHIADSATGLTYMQARYYDPVTGRFLANDPVGYLGHLYRGKSVLGFNRYAYANNNPYKYTDPDGEFAQVAIGAFTGGLISGVAYAITTDNFSAKDLAVHVATGAAVGAVTAFVPGAIAAGSLNFGSKAANIAASGGNAVTAGAAGSVANQAATTGNVDAGKALVAGVANAAGVGAGAALVKPAAAVATVKTAGNPGLPVRSLNGNTFMIGKVNPTSVTSEGVQQTVQDIAGETASALINQATPCVVNGESC